MFSEAQSCASEAAVLPASKLRHSNVCLSFRGVTGRITLSLSCCWLTSGCFMLLPISQGSPRPQLAGWVKANQQILCFQSPTRHQEQIGDSGTISINK